ncbi:MAG TPA: tyrosinase family protein [Thermoanaerobaculia bacterium]|nr:tyrosinase family protein [Thermoanaerobaculia bacterium]
MAEYTRANAWNNGGTFDNPVLLWYAKGVGAMQARELNDPASWWFFAAIHGEYVSETGFPGWGDLPAPPSVPTSPLPSASDQDKYWDQCQHQSWYFPPWHRGYLLALEAQLRADIISLGGPSDWALPYWDYFETGQDAIPPAFTQETLPDGNPNPLFVTARYGPNNDGNIFVPMPPVNQNSMSNTLYTGSNAATKPPGFGGPQTGFSHSGGTSGNLENNPHNLVHVFVGGNSPDGETWGLMSDPGLAGLDPVFYLHHANIDRMWAAWNANPSNANPTDPNWLNGPAAIGEREFVMPWPGGSSWVYTPQEVNSLDQLDYTYENLPAPAAAPAEERLAQRLTRLGAAPELAAAQEGVAVAPSKSVELVGANRGALAITGSGVSTTINLDPDVRRQVSASLAAAGETAQPDRVFLNLENVRGARDASVLNVYVNLPEGAAPGDHPEHLAGSVGLFGLRRASSPDGRHGGQGLNFVLDITDIFDTLHLDNALNVDSLQVKIVPHQPVPEQADITVGRVSIYRQGQ